jgi:hypothetical protein
MGFEQRTAILHCGNYTQMQKPEAVQVASLKEVGTLVSSSLFPVMALPSVRSLAAAQKLVQSLNSDTPMQRRIDITSIITDENWPMMEEAGYADFLISQTRKELQNSVSVGL